jgi:hypothetical protein|tara:strand:- start:422 stop:640 length:219 start_codon:yes stop_codon:yes gene_type:complete|eukprot:30928-Pelagococcus_subviridis.AAC.11
MTLPRAWKHRHARLAKTFHHSDFGGLGFFSGDDARSPAPDVLSYRVAMVAAILPGRAARSATTECNNCNRKK